MFMSAEIVAAVIEVLSALFKWAGAPLTLDCHQ